MYSGGLPIGALSSRHRCPHAAAFEVRRRGGSLMVPGKNRVIDAELHVRSAETGEIYANATLREGEIIFIKFKGQFRKEL